MAWHIALLHCDKTVLKNVAGLLNRAKQQMMGGPELPVTTDPAGGPAAPTLTAQATRPMPMPEPGGTPGPIPMPEPGGTPDYAGGVDPMMLRKRLMQQGAQSGPYIPPSPSG